MKILTEMADRGFLPDPLIRFGIRRLDKKRLSTEKQRSTADQGNSIHKLVGQMQQSPIAIQPHKANEQHYELPPGFFQYVLVFCVYPLESLENELALTCGLV